MPLQAKVTPLSLYMLDNSIFDGLQLPTMPTNPTDYPDLYVQGFNLDREVLVNNILMETGEMDVIYPEPDFFKFAVTQWSKKELPVWQELYNTLFYKYNPLWNKDGTIKETARDLTSRETAGTRSRSGTSAEDMTDAINETETHNLEDERTLDLSTQISDTTENTGTVGDAGQELHTIIHSGNVTTTGTTGGETQVSAYNETTYRNRDKTSGTSSQTVADGTTVNDNVTKGNTRTDNLEETYDSSKTETGTDTMARTGTIGRIGENTTSKEGSEEESEETSGTEEGSLDHTLTRTEQGNIGITMTSQLISAQREIVQLNFYDLIIERFKERFCLLVY